MDWFYGKHIFNETVGAAYGKKANYNIILRRDFYTG